MRYQRMFIVAVLAVSLALLVSGTTLAASTRSLFHITAGKYNVPELHRQNEHCLNFVCDRCMYDEFPDPSNPFDPNDGWNCNGMSPYTNPIFHGMSHLFGLDWESYVLYVQRDVLLNTINTCWQNWNTQIRCTAWDPVFGQWVDIQGAYQVGSEFSLGLLDGYIDRYTTGYPPGMGPGDWDDLHDYAGIYMYHPMLSSYHAWGRVYHATLIYWAEAVMQYPVKDGGAKSLDEEFALKVMAHALVCWQCWEDGSSEIDLVGANGIACWPFIVSETPSFVYEISWALADLIDLPVEAKRATWGSLKASYR